MGFSFRFTKVYNLGATFWDLPWHDLGLESTAFSSTAGCWSWWPSRQRVWLGEDVEQDEGTVERTSTRFGCCCFGSLLVTGNLSSIAEICEGRLGATELWPLREIQAMAILPNWQIKVGELGLEKCKMILKTHSFCFWMLLLWIHSTCSVWTFDLRSLFCRIILILEEYILTLHRALGTPLFLISLARKTGTYVLKGDGEAGGARNPSTGGQDCDLEKFCVAFSGTILWEWTILEGHGSAGWAYRDYPGPCFLIPCDPNSQCQFGCARAGYDVFHIQRALWGRHQWVRHFAMSFVSHLRPPGSHKKSTMDSEVEHTIDARVRNLGRVEPLANCMYVIHFGVQLVCKRHCGCKAPPTLALPGWSVRKHGCIFSPSLTQMPLALTFLYPYSLNFSTCSGAQLPAKTL